MSSIMQSFQKRTLPVSHSNAEAASLRRRLSSLSLKIQRPIGRSKSMGDAAEVSSLRKWWDWGCSWILSRKPVFAQDLEMNEEETAILGCHSKGSWRHVFYKVRSEFKKIVGSHKVGLPQTCRYDSFSYSKNFDDGTSKIQD
ncbi:uncharacterized protein LOC126676500 [Mercurialis annua]|uniref:uncharacterized protein LOC126676500 n=1 Tax=Mercurialis annua TaxID=3986 RepID=UPI00215FE9E7|nr:uncharacterized protein LOC126676500 [Mercurialis annua]